jgi:hypothetical protein
MPGKQVTELDALPSFTDTSLLPVHNGAGLKKGLLSQLANYLGTKFSNPNLLINPDFKINQRGNTTYTKDNQGPAIYTVDRWVVWNGTLDANSMLLKAYDSGIGLIMQRLENKINGISTVSFEVSSISGTLTALARGTSGNSLGEISVTQKGIYQFTANGEISDITFKISAGGSVTFAWAKLEHGSIATPFVAPNPAEELVKCKRYYNRIYFYHVFYSATSNFDYSFSHVIQSMRTKPTVKLSQSSSSGLSKYSASVNTDSGLTVITTATTSKVGNCNTGGIVELDAEIY